MRRIAVALSAFALVLTLGACNLGNNGFTLSSRQRAQFMSGCEKNSYDNVNGCNCVIDWAQSNLTSGQFWSDVASMNDGGPLPSEWSGAIGACAQDFPTGPTPGSTGSSGSSGSTGSTGSSGSTGTTQGTF